MLLFTSREVQHFVFILDQDGSFRLRLRDIQTACEHGYLGLLYFLDHAFWLTSEDHTPYDFAVCQASTHDLNNADIVHIEVLRIWRHDGQCSFSNKCGKSIFIAILFGCNGWLECSGKGRLCRW